MHEYEKIHKVLTENTQRLQKACNVGLVMSDYVSKIQQSAMQSLCQIHDAYASVFQDIEMTLHAVMGGIANFDVCQSCAKTWGEYGWTLPYDCDVKQLYRHPTSQMDADRWMLSYCTEDNLSCMYDDIFKHSMCDVFEFCHALDDFYQGDYRSCVKFLLPLIDGLLAQMANRTSQNKYKICGTAITDIQRKFGSNYLDLEYSNVFACLQKIFESVKPDEEHGNVLNRHEIMHGLPHKDVKKVDCVRLLVLYWHTLRMYDAVKIIDANFVS